MVKLAFRDVPWSAPRRSWSNLRGSGRAVSSVCAPSRLFSRTRSRRIFQHGDAAVGIDEDTRVGESQMRPCFRDERLASWVPS
jgi:hypothetical protein